ncbi:MAG: alpha/beta fold hydrolase [Candidatus Eremiobacteraeota bacterium]|nr:alpha/beta fold hydrolase [Candidatus Eremiobacteraeota bacterium]
MDQVAVARKELKLGDGCVSYVEAGAGPPLLLIHGIGHSSTAWLRSLPALSERHRVIALDLPGHGHGTTVNGRYDPAYFSELTNAFCEALGLASVDVVGTSLGGLVALLSVLGQPERFRRVVLVSPLGFTKPPVPPLDDAVLHLFGLWLSFPRTRALVRAGYAAGFFDPSRIDDASVDEITAHAQSQARLDAARRTLREIFHFSKRLAPLHARLADLHHPTLVIWGRNDPVLPAKDAEIARRVLPAPRIEVFERCGHNPHIEQSEAFCALVLEFLTTA